MRQLPEDTVLQAFFIANFLFKVQNGNRANILI